MAQRLNYVELAPAGMAAMSSVEHYLNTASGLEGSLLELVRLLVSLRNGCEYCVGLHTHGLTKRHEPEGRVAGVAGWRESEAYTVRERAAFAWAEKVTEVQAEHVPDAAFAAAREHFSEVDLVNLTMAVASINAWNRMGIAFRAEKRRLGASANNPAVSAADEGAPKASPSGGDADDDGGKVAVEE